MPSDSFEGENRLAAGGFRGWHCPLPWSRLWVENSLLRGPGSFPLSRIFQVDVVHPDSYAGQGTPVPGRFPFLSIMSQNGILKIRPSPGFRIGRSTAGRPDGGMIGKVPTAHGGCGNADRVRQLPVTLPNQDIDAEGIQGSGGALPQVRRNDRRPDPGERIRDPGAGRPHETANSPSQAVSRGGESGSLCRG